MIISLTMLPFLGPLIVSAVPAASWFYAAWKWFRSLKADGPAARWRTAFTATAVLSSAVSSGLVVFLLWHAAFTGGYPFYHPVELFCLRVGARTALLGLGAGPLGQRGQRLLVSAVSAVDLLLWIWDGMAQ